MARAEKTKKEPRPRKKTLQFMMTEADRAAYDARAEELFGPGLGAKSKYFHHLCSLDTGQVGAPAGAHEKRTIPLQINVYPDEHLAFSQKAAERFGFTKGAKTDYFEFLLALDDGSPLESKDD